MGVGPLPLERLEEALDLAVPARRVGRGEDLAGCDPLELGPEGKRAVAVAVVAHHRLGWLQPERREVRDRPAHEPGRRARRVRPRAPRRRRSGSGRRRRRARRRSRSSVSVLRLRVARPWRDVRAGESAPSGRCRREAALPGATTRSGGSSPAASAEPARAPWRWSTFQIVERARRTIPAKTPRPEAGLAPGAQDRLLLGGRQAPRLATGPGAAVAKPGARGELLLACRRRRCHQRWAVAGATLRAAAAALNVIPDSIARRARAALPVREQR